MSRGEANGVKVECFRDTGSSVSIVRSSLVTPDQYTGKVVTCILVDQCVKKCPQAEIVVKTEWYDGKLPVVCTDRCIYDLIVGNDVHYVTQKETTVETDNVLMNTMMLCIIIMPSLRTQICRKISRKVNDTMMKCQTRPKSQGQ